MGFADRKFNERGIMAGTNDKPLFVSRGEVGRLFPGLNKKTLANLLSEGRGPAAFRTGRKIFYRVQDVEDWLTENPILTIDQGGAE